MPTGEYYVAFVDLLGFSALVDGDWQKALDEYRFLSEMIEGLHDEQVQRYKRHGNSTRSDPELVIASDSVMIAGESLYRVLDLVQAVQTAALLGTKLLARGCVSYGKHFHEQRPNKYSVVSVPLARAVAGEKTAHYPRVILDRETGVEEQARALVAGGSPIALDCEDGLWMVQPFILDGKDFNLEYYDNHLEPLVAQYAKTKHAPKWDWMRNTIKKVEALLENLSELGAEIEAERIREERWDEDDG